ncbi:AroM family protein [Sporosarcina sp. D27]|uniref:AroM family protein n=1 Tax=Sporosarcina sp. D27 TaxID=1382305 RepID=UPI0004714BA5|nr:AroM family protein [Sporosarcina sp. D27]
MITLLTIGQTPRPDLLAPFVSKNISHVRLVGALDDITPEAIHQLPISDKEEKLYAVLNDGSATVGHQFIEQRLQKLVHQFEPTSEAIAILCMSEFSHLSSEVPLLFPFEELKVQSSVIRSNNRTAIFVPIPEQLITAPAKWDCVEGDKHFFAVGPKSECHYSQIMAQVRKYAPEFVILDCYGYGTELPDTIENAYPCRCFGAQNALLDKVIQLSN